MDYYNFGYVAEQVKKTSDSDDDYTLCSTTTNSAQVTKAIDKDARWYEPFKHFALFLGNIYGYDILDKVLIKDTYNDVTISLKDMPNE